MITDLELLRQAAEPLKFISENGIEKEEGAEIISKIKEALEADTNILAIAAPVLGFNKRIFGIKFADSIKIFIDPIITKKNQIRIAPETFVGMPGKEILISRPEEITAVYYTEEFKYEENKLLGAAARLFDQQTQLLDGILPDDLGLVSDVETDGSLADLSESEIAELIEFYKQYVQLKVSKLQSEIEADPEMSEQYKQLAFTEKVINGKAALVAKDGTELKQQTQNKAQAKAALKIKQITNADKAQNTVQLKQFLNRKGK